MLNKSKINLLVYGKYILLTLSTALIIYGCKLGEIKVVLTKAINICLECIGIG
ncbi:CD1871A family CXXC motif-containing protein [Clostridium sediminicola]|uniref:CD1871A family CXXC motif-containing protein n=1 Tax=Clostridium sediminicola TaxID=3114879 RepID=UPI003D17606D